MLENRIVILFLYKNDNDNKICDNTLVIINQLLINNIDDIIIIYNKYYKSFIDSLNHNNIKYVLDNSSINYLDVSTFNNIFKNINKTCILIDCALVMENDLIKYIVGTDFQENSTWFTSNNYNNNVFIKSDKYGNIINYNSNDKENIFTSIIRININDLDIYKSILNNYDKNLSNNFYTQWLCNNNSNTKEADISNFCFYNLTDKDSYNKYKNIKMNIIKKCPSYQLVNIELLKDIENHDKKRVDILINKIKNDNLWTMPVIVEDKYNMVLDGHHRLNASKKLEFKKIPVIYVNYNDVKVWTLRKEYPVSVSKVKEKVIDNKEIYPYKTVKHKFNFINKEISVTLDTLK